MAKFRARGAFPGSVSNRLCAPILAGALVMGSCAVALGADLPASTRKILNDLKLDASILSNIDKELVVPAAWIEAAKKEKALEVWGPLKDSEFEALSAPFRERYPFVQIKYSVPPRQDRAMKPLIALKANRYVTDMILGLEGEIFHYMENNLLENVGDMPNLARVPEKMRDPQNMWATMRLRYWCAGYNTEQIKKAELPKTWDDILTHPKLKAGHLAFANRPNQWMGPLWSEKGDAWGTEYMTKMFKNVRPQLRKENTAALAGLMAAGEFSMVITADSYRISELQGRGAPVAYFCPSPAPVQIVILGILKGSPRANSAKLFLNWLLSKEGQISSYAADESTPVHEELRHERRFLPNGGEGINSDEIALLGPDRTSVLPRVYAIWNKLWEEGGGQKER